VEPGQAAWSVTMTREVLVTGAVILVVGLVLCFLGIGSLNAATLAAGFALGWLLADLFDASTATALLVALAVAGIGWIVVSLVFRLLAFVLGGLLGAVIGAWVYAIFERGDTSVVLAAVVVLAFAAFAGVLAHRWRRRFLLWATAFGGAGLALAGFARLVPAASELRSPATDTATVVSAAAWVALALAGVIVQRSLFASRLDERDAS
jgi:hypothetical protein